MEDDEGLVQGNLVGPPAKDRTIHTVLADPPWNRESGGGESTRGAQRHYPLMTPQEIAATIRHDCPYWAHLAEQAHLYLWVTNATMAVTNPTLGDSDARWLAHRLGFEPKTLITWAKADEGDPSNGPQKGLGQYTFGATEHILFCTRGPFMKPDTRIPTWFAAERSEHSSKPEKQYDLIESASPGEYLELFAREDRKGWKVFGNEV